MFQSNGDTVLGWYTDGMRFDKKTSMVWEGGEVNLLVHKIKTQTQLGNISLSSDVFILFWSWKT